MDILQYNVSMLGIYLGIKHFLTLFILLNLNPHKYYIQLVANTCVILTKNIKL